jgi:hypothetical protein
MTTNKDESIIGRLFSDNDSVALETLNEISHSGRTHFIPILTELLHSSSNREIRDSIIRIFSELKQTSAAPVLVEMIKNPKFINERELLVRTCWENGLDYSPYISDFVEILINGDYMTAFESYTVLINTEGKISSENAVSSIRILKESLPALEDERKTLVEDVISFLNDFK